MNSMVSFVLFCILWNGFASAQTLIQDSCKKAFDPRFDYDGYVFCVKSLTEDPQSKAATSFEGLVLASMKNAEVELTNIKGIVEQMLKDKKWQGIEKGLHDCVRDYDSANDNINIALANAKSHDYKTARKNLYIALDAPTNCEVEIFDRRTLKSPITTENSNLRKKILIAYVFTDEL